MDWVDVCGPPGAGKSTLCDPLWHPHSIVTDGKLPPEEWQDFTNEVTRLMHLLKDHKSFVSLVRMCRRSFHKMAAVARTETEDCYIQAGFAQRGLGIGWRLIDSGLDIRELKHFFRLMPVSRGVVLLESESLLERNKARENVAETAHENRSFMVPLMRPGIELMKDCLSNRGIPFMVLSTEQDIEDARGQLVDFAAKGIGYAKTGRPDFQVEVLSPPAWW